MWALPDIDRINKQAESRIFAAKADAINKGLRRNETCDACEQTAIKAELWYDIFSDDPKGINLSCEDHSDGGVEEGFFLCDGCNRIMILNYTWELYRVTQKDGSELCLPCAAKQYVADDTNWIDLQGAFAVDFHTVRKAPHVIGVKMPVPKEVKLFEDVEMDGATGGRLTSTMSAEQTPDGAVTEIKDHLQSLKEFGVKRAILIMDAAYQFSVSVGVYVDADAPVVAQ